MKKYIFLLLIFVCFTSCWDDISTEARISPSPITFKAKRKVLIEDFSGQLCGHCPMAAAAIRNIQQIYGHTNVIAVAIHGGTFELPYPLTDPRNLATDFGRDLSKKYSINQKPRGLVDGMMIESFKLWSAQVVKDLQQKAEYDLDLSSSVYNTKQRELRVNCTVSSHKLGEVFAHIWLTEDSIRGFQQQMSGATQTYMHNHILRASLTPIGGTSLLTRHHGKVTITKTTTIPELWKSENVVIVAFITDSKGHVLQVESCPLVVK